MSVVSRRRRKVKFRKEKREKREGRENRQKSMCVRFKGVVPSGTGQKQSLITLDQSTQINY